MCLIRKAFQHVRPLSWTGRHGCHLGWAIRSGSVADEICFTVPFQSVGRFFIDVLGILNLLYLGQRACVSILAGFKFDRCW